MGSKSHYAADIEKLLGPLSPKPTSALPDAVTADALGELVGISGRQVREWAARGVLKKAGLNAYTVRESVRAYCAALREQAAARGGSKTLTEERTRLAREQADALALKNAAARGELLPSAQVETEWAAILRDVRAATLALPSRLQQKLSHLTAHDVATIDREIRDLLSELGNAD